MAEKIPSVKSPVDMTIAEQRKADGKPSPLEIMLQVMDDQYMSGQFLTAAAIAEKCAPYFHPRLSALAVSTDKEKPIPVNHLDQLASRLVALQPNRGVIYNGQTLEVEDAQIVQPVGV